MKGGFFFMKNAVRNIFAVALILAGIIFMSVSSQAATLRVTNDGITISKNQEENYILTLESSRSKVEFRSYQEHISWDELLTGSSIRKGDPIQISLKADGQNITRNVVAGNQDGVDGTSSRKTVQPRTSGTTSSSSTSSAGWSKTGQNYWTYHNPDGSLVYGWAKYQGQWYYLDPNYGGQMAYGGWLQIGGKWYCFAQSGYMYANTWIKFYYSGKPYYYYLKADGSMAHDEWIGEFYVNNRGEWIGDPQK
jgi:putative cell wall binding repeat-containing protein